MQSGQEGIKTASDIFTNAVKSKRQHVYVFLWTPNIRARAHSYTRITFVAVIMICLLMEFLLYFPLLSWFQKKARDLLLVCAFDCVGFLGAYFCLIAYSVCQSVAAFCHVGYDRCLSLFLHTTRCRLFQYYSLFSSIFLSLFF